jgi:hypothetical protein
LEQLLNFLNVIPNGEIRVVAYVNGTGHDFASNQWAGEGVLQGNIGGSPPNLETDVPGLQFVTVPNPAVAAAAAVPEPASISMVALSLAAAAFACRR